MFIYSLFRMPFLGLRTSQLKCEVRKNICKTLTKFYVVLWKCDFNSTIDQGWVRRPSHLLLFQTFHPRHRHLGRLLQVPTVHGDHKQFNSKSKHYIPLKRRPRASLPRIHLFRGLITLLLALFLVAFWLFYGVRYTFLVITCLSLTFFCHNNLFLSQ